MLNRSLSIIAAFDLNHVIGNQGRLPWKLPIDLQYFKKMTIGKPIVMGRKTYQSIGQALPDRRNMVLTRNPKFSAADAEIFYSLKDAIEQTNEKELMVIGGATLFKEALSIANRLYLTKIDHAFKGDAYFPSVDWNHWHEIKRQHFIADDVNRYNGTFIVLERVEYA